MRDLVLSGVAVALTLNMLACLVLVARGRTGRDRLLPVILTGTTGAGVLAVLSVLLHSPGLRDAALVVVALAALVSVSRVAAEGGLGRR